MATPGAVRASTADSLRYVRSSGGYLVGCLLAGAVAGVAAGWLWTRLASPPAGVLTSTGVVFGEAQLNQDVGVTLWFLVTGVGVSFVLGLLSAWRGDRYGVLAVLAVLISSCVASLVSYWFGVHVFGPDTRAQLASANPGDKITTAVSVGTKIAFLGWPAGALVGTLLAISCWPQTRPTRTGAHLTVSAATD